MLPFPPEVSGEYDRGLELLVLDFNWALSFATNGGELWVVLTAATFFNAASTRFIAVNMHTVDSTLFMSTASCVSSSSLLLPVEELLRLDLVASISALRLRRTSSGPMVISIGNACSGATLRDFWL
jgi:hypothetical protein